MSSILRSESDDYTQYYENFLILDALKERAIRNKKNPDTDPDVLAMKNRIFSFDQDVKDRHGHYFTYPPKKHDSRRKPLTAACSKMLSEIKYGIEFRIESEKNKKYRICREVIKTDKRNDIIIVSHVFDNKVAIRNIFFEYEKCIIQSTSDANLKRATRFSAGIDIWISLPTILKDTNTIYPLHTRTFLYSEQPNSPPQLALIVGRSSVKHSAIIPSLLDITNQRKPITVYARPIIPSILQENQKILQVVLLKTYYDNLEIEKYLDNIGESPFYIVGNTFYCCNDIILAPKERVLIKTNYVINEKCQKTSQAYLICPVDPNPLALTTVNYGLIDSDYALNIGIVLINFSDSTTIIEKDTPIAKILVLHVYLNDNDDNIDRSGGFGSTDSGAFEYKGFRYSMDPLSETSETELPSIPSEIEIETLPKDVLELYGIKQKSNVDDEKVYDFNFSPFNPVHIGSIKSETFKPLSDYSKTFEKTNN